MGDHSILANQMSSYVIYGGTGLLIYFSTESNATCADPDQTTHFAVSDLGLNCLPKRQYNYFFLINFFYVVEQKHFYIYIYIFFF